MKTISISAIKERIESDFLSGGLSLSGSHYESGISLHREQFYFVKQIFQNTAYCDALALSLTEKLKAQNFNSKTTLVGFQNFMTYLLSKTNDVSNSDYNYAIIEPSGDSFTWHEPPELHENIVIILPISSTGSTYFRIRKWIINNKQYSKSSEVNSFFISMFLVLDDFFNGKESVKIANIKSVQPELFDLCNSFNWELIDGSNVTFKSSKTKLSSIIMSYSKIYSADICPLCFPDKSTDERPMFSVSKNYETPRLIFGFPKFNIQESQPDLFKTFGAEKSPYNVHLYGHVKVDNGSYSNYIRGNMFYAYTYNRLRILDYFERELSLRIKDNCKKIVFVTGENKHDSNFLEDFAQTRLLYDIDVSILRFRNNSDFIDNFISLYKAEFNDSDALLIYYEDVLSGGRTFKLISDSIKHSRLKEGQVTSHGFDLIFSLVDRTPRHTEIEIVKKLVSDINDKDAFDYFISYFKLNVPVFAASQLGNPLITRNSHLKKMTQSCHIDSLKHTISTVYLKNQPNLLPEYERDFGDNKKVQFFPFARFGEDNFSELVNIYKKLLIIENHELIKLYLIHEINSEFAKHEYNDDNYSLKYKADPALFIDDLIQKILGRNNVFDHFIDDKYLESNLRKHNVEREILHDYLVKFLTRHPYIYYKNIKESIFAYCLKKLNTLYEQVEKDKITSFEIFRKLKFYIKRSVELNSNFIISSRFLLRLKQQYDINQIKNIIEGYDNTSKELNIMLKDGKIDYELYQIAINSIQYKRSHVSSYFTFLLACYKELIYRNPYRSIEVESLVNSKLLLPDEIETPSKEQSKLKALIQDPYFQFTGMLKSENIYPIEQLKEFHLSQFKSEEYKTIQNYASHYLRRSKKKNDPIIVNAQKMIDKSRFQNLESKQNKRRNLTSIKNSVSKMLSTAELLSTKANDVLDSTGSFNREIKEVLNSVLDIITHDLDKSLFDYGLFVKYKGEKDKYSADSIYSIMSTDRDDNSDVTLLREDGLVFNMLCGVKDDLAFKSTQTLLFVAKDDLGDYFSFNDNVELNNEERTYASITDLCKKDLYDDKLKIGVKIFNDAKMSILLRFSNFDIDANCSYGNAILLITSKQNVRTKNFLSFFSNEKIRLVLLLKDMLREYLNKQFGNEAFLDILENRKRAIYQRHLRHGLGDYLFYQSQIMDNISAGISPKTNREVYDIIDNAIRGQLNLYKAKQSMITVSKSDFMHQIIMIFKSPLGKVNIEPNDVEFDCSFEALTLEKSIYDVVIPELIINMKKYSPRIDPRGLRIEFSEDYSFTFINNRRSTSHNNSDKRPIGESRLGLIMCNKILKHLDHNELKIDEADNKHFVKLELKK